MRTLLLAVSLSLSTMVSYAQETKLTDQERALMKGVDSSIITLSKGTSVKGVAVLIDATGLFIAHRVVVTYSTMTGKLSNGKTVTLQMISFDDPSQLVLLKANDWKPFYGQPIRVAESSPKAGEKVVAIISTGLVKAEITSTDRFGIVGQNRRLMPLDEIKLQAPIDQLGGGLLFTMQGELVGIIGASLKQTDLFNTSTQQRAVQSNQGSAGGGMAGGPGISLTKSFSKNGMYQSFGPNSLTIAYVINPSVLSRVVSGFRSPERQASHPMIGIFCRDSVRGGALVDAVTPNHPADKAGMLPGDIIIELGKYSVRNQLDFAQAMMNQEIGKEVVVKVLRNGTTLSLIVTIGK